MRLPREIDGAFHAVRRIALKFAAARGALAGRREKQGEQVAEQKGHRGRHSRALARRLALAALTLAACPALAQDPSPSLAERLDKARAEINTVENAADRAVYACERQQVEKCTLEARTAANAASRALYAVDRAIRAVTPAEPPPEEIPAPSGFVVGTNMDAGFPQLDAIPTNFPIEGMLRPDDIPGAASPSEPGAFRFICQASHLSYDDPIVYAGQPGASHLHMFFGNTLADAHSTFESLRTTGKSTCNNALNRSAYWMPALMNGRGQVVMPDYISIYYKRPPQSDPECAQGKGCIGLPRGLRFVFGRTMSGGETGHVHFACDNPGTPMVSTATLAEAAKGCPIGARIGAVAEAPDCWDGVNLDSPDHRSHVTNSLFGGPVGKYCPASHPYRIPAFTLGAWFTVDATLDRSGDMSPDAHTWYFASDRMPGMAPVVSGTTFHSDWYGAWDDPTMDKWIANCIDKHLNCSGGLLGNGEIITHSPEFTAARPHLVAAPERGGTVWLFPDP